ncbi:dsDNA nuclease domain-containing protein [Rhizobium leguminosarum]|uniref:dsDNA nuclease domain-containing protein n=1 Tax=Rhizobium leguminosarum TaxID=384 RepID=UPI001F1D9A2B|nr:dsDNA nuclease domain-containing protein [Rhizobium leguminosarum]UIJ79118.1 DUF4297 domain-containing protein [Rhizobium leguminosarum]
MTIIEDLLTVPERENGGRTAYDRFDFQTAWGLTKVISLHSSGAEYAVAFEFHDDIAEVDDLSSPTRLSFYQVKTTKSPIWSLAKISQRTKSGETRKPSYAGKMFDNVERFGAAVDKVVFVSNRPLSELSSDLGEAPFSAAEKAKLDKFVSALESECAGFKPTDHLPLFRFSDCGLHLDTYDQTLLGVVTKFLEDTIGSGVDSRAFNFILVDECRQRSKKLADLKGIDELKLSKFLTRADITEKLQSFQKRRQHRPEWTSVLPYLNLPFAHAARIEREWRNYEMSRFERPYASGIEFADAVKNIVEAIMETASTMWDGVSQALPAVRSLIRQRFGETTDDFERAVILYEFKR